MIPSLGGLGVVVGYLLQVSEKKELGGEWSWRAILFNPKASAPEMNPCIAAYPGGCGVGDEAQRLAAQKKTIPYSGFVNLFSFLLSTLHSLAAAPDPFASLFCSFSHFSQCPPLVCSVKSKIPQESCHGLITLAMKLNCARTSLIVSL